MTEDKINYDLSSSLNLRTTPPILTDDDLRRLISLSAAYCDLVRFAGVENPVAKRVEQLLIMLLTPAFVVESK